MGAEDQGMSSSELGGLRILIVEDDPIIALDVAETRPTLAQ
jgi:arginase family enzyme